MVVAWRRERERERERERIKKEYIYDVIKEYCLDVEYIVKE